MSNATHASGFVRDHSKYIVVKVKDLDIYQKPELLHFLNEYEIPTRTGVFIDEDWGVYDEAWKLVEKEVKGE